MKLCNICTKKHYAHGYCSRHYYANKKYGDANHKLECRSGKSKHPLYCTYRNMVKRCTKPYKKDAGQYKERGIRVCKSWLGEFGFDNFIKDMGTKPIGKSIDRINNDGNYEPSNCRWATPQEQAHNTRRNNNHPNVYFNKRKAKWYAQMMIDRKRYSKGYYDTLEEAQKALNYIKVEYGV